MLRPSSAHRPHKTNTPTAQSGQRVIVYFLITESPFFIRFFRSLGVDYLMINDGENCVRSGVCPTTTKFQLPRLMASGARGAA